MLTGRRSVIPRNASSAVRTPLPSYFDLAGTKSRAQVLTLE